MSPRGVRLGKGGLWHPLDGSPSASYLEIEKKKGKAENEKSETRKNGVRSRTEKNEIFERSFTRADYVRSGREKVERSLIPSSGIGPRARKKSDPFPDRENGQEEKKVRKRRTEG